MSEQPAVQEETTAQDTTESAEKVHYTAEQQEHINNLISRAVARAKSEADKARGELEAKASKWDEWEQAQKSELERAREEADKYRSELEQAQATIKEADLRSQVFTAASKSNAVNASQVFALVKDQLVEGANIEEIVSAFLDENPHFVASKAPGVQVPTVQGASKQDRTEGMMSLAELQALTAQQLASDPALMARAKAAQAHYAKNGR